MIGNPLDTFRLTPFGELLTGSAYKTHPTDATVGLGERFAGQTILFVWIAGGTGRARNRCGSMPRANRSCWGAAARCRAGERGELTNVLRAEKKASGANGSWW